MIVCMAPRPTATQRQRKPQPKRRPWLVLLPWFVTLGLLGVSAAIAFVPREATLRDPTVPGQTGALVWGDGVFSNALELQAWLRIRGVTYAEWARKHPAAKKKKTEATSEVKGVATSAAGSADDGASWADRLGERLFLVLLALLVPLGALTAVALSRTMGSTP